MAKSTAILLLGLSCPLLAAAFSSPLRLSSTSLITFQHQQRLSASHPQRRPTFGVSSLRMLDFFAPPPKADGGVSPVVSISRESDLEELLQQSMVARKPLCVNWYTPSCRKCIALKTRYRRIAKDPEHSCIFAEADANLIELTDGRPAGPLRLLQRCGVSAFPTLQVWFNGLLIGEVIPDDYETPSGISTRFNTLLSESSSAINDQTDESKKISSGDCDIPGPALRMAGVGATRHAYEKAHDIAVRGP